MTKLQDEIRAQQERFQKKIKFEVEINAKLEGTAQNYALLYHLDLVRNELGETYLYNFKNSLARDTPLPTANSYSDAKNMCRNLLPSGGRVVK